MRPVMEGAGLNIIVLSYMGYVDIGFVVSRDLISDAWALVDHAEDALAELLAAVDG